MNTGVFKNIDKCYAIGDIHGDLNVFIDFLKSIGIVKRIIIPSNFNCYNYSIINYKQIINKYITFTNLNKLSNTAIVQLGDISDGHNTCNKASNEFINNDIFCYAILDEISKRLTNNSHIISILGNHDINTIFSLLDKSRIDNANCLKKFNWAQYILNADEINIDELKKKKIIKHKLRQRIEFFTSIKDFFINHSYFIVSINDKTFFSHTLLYQKLVDEFLEKYKALTGETTLNFKVIQIMNAIMKYCFTKIRKLNKIDKEIIDNLVKHVSNRTLIIINETRQLANIGEDKIKHWFIGHEPRDEITMTKDNTNIIDMYIYYLDVGLSKSVKDYDWKNDYYYVMIKYYNNNITIKKFKHNGDKMIGDNINCCNDEKCGDELCMSGGKK